MSAVTRRYARAFVDVVLHGHLDADGVFEELRTIAATHQMSPELRKVWASPAVAAEQKRGLLDAIAAREGISRATRNFIAVLIDHRRIALLDEVLEDFKKQLSSRLDFAEAEITSARELNISERRTLEFQIERLTGKKVRARYGRDESILGGAIVQVGSTIYDGSIRGQLERIREQLSSN
ncbi:MAG: ATP synthase F1 subunit delta [Acidobacteria bacterium]|nr:ATP synthase F1 subunit delta [Acidobacteriota bacterium]